MVELGDMVRDRLTGFTGIVVNQTEWLYGCVRCSVQSIDLHEGKPIALECFDYDQLVLVEKGMGLAPASSRKTTDEVELPVADPAITVITGGLREVPQRANDPSRM